jgi:hypothetical protein
MGGTMRKHENLFGYFSTKQEVYNKLQEDYDRDQRACGRCLIAAPLLGIAAGFVDATTWKIPLLIGAGVALLQYLIIFIDNSNRNFLLHAIDWLEAKARNDD